MIAKYIGICDTLGLNKEEKYTVLVSEAFSTQGYSSSYGFQGILVEVIFPERRLTLPYTNMDKVLKDWILEAS